MFVCAEQSSPPGFPGVLGEKRAWLFIYLRPVFFRKIHNKHMYKTMDNIENRKTNLTLAELALSSDMYTERKTCSQSCIREVNILGPGSSLI